MDNGKRIMENEEIIASDELEIVDGELLEISEDDEIEKIIIEEETKVTAKKDNEISFPKTKNQTPKTENQNSKYYLQYVFLPLIFLTVTLLGGLRIGIEADEFVFLKPALICLVFGAILLVLFFRAKLIRLDGWFSEDFSTLKNIANGAVIFSLFTAATQVFNSLIPEQGLPFWIIAFCFFWTLWNNLFAEFDTKRLLQSLGGLFGLAFVVKYLVLANIASTEQGSWLTRIWENPTQEFITYILDIPRFSSATGYIQFFTIMFFLIGLFLLKPQTKEIQL
ncbi:MAG: hypothetical protein ACR2J3_01885 [Aridibacter sp.]